MTYPTVTVGRVIKLYLCLYTHTHKKNTKKPLDHLLEITIDFYYYSVHAPCQIRFIYQTCHKVMLCQNNKLFSYTACQQSIFTPCWQPSNIMTEKTVAEVAAYTPKVHLCHPLSERFCPLPFENRTRDTPFSWQGSCHH